MIEEILKEQGKIKFTKDVQTGRTFITSSGEFMNIVDAITDGTISQPTDSQKTVHNAVDEYIKELLNEEKVIKDVLVIKDNMIKVTNNVEAVRERSYILLPENEPTKEQYDALELWLMSQTTSEFVDIIKYSNDIRSVVKSLRFSVDESKDNSVINHVADIMRIVKDYYRSK